MSTKISSARLLALKRRAVRLKRSTPGLKHAAALDEVAKSEGFANWSLLANAAGGSGAAENKLIPGPGHSRVSGSHTVMLSGIVRSGKTEQKIWHEHLNTKYPLKRYVGFRWLPRYRTVVHRDEAGAQEIIATAKRGIAFMDTTGLRPSRANARVFGRGPNRGGFDHTCVWLDETNRYIVTTEPYIGSDSSEMVKAWCEGRGWNWAELPQQHGIWNPCGSNCEPDCRRHTRMIVIAPAKNGGDVRAIVDALLS